MGFLNGLSWSLKLALLLGILTLLTLLVGFIRLGCIQRRFKRLEELERFHKREESKANGSRPLDEGDYFGIRALEKGYYGGIAQSQPTSAATTPASSPRIFSDHLIGLPKFSRKLGVLQHDFAPATRISSSLWSMQMGSSYSMKSLEEYCSKSEDSKPDERRGIKVSSNYPSRTSSQNSTTDGAEDAPQLHASSQIPQQPRRVHSSDNPASDTVSFCGSIAHETTDPKLYITKQSRKGFSTPTVDWRTESVIKFPYATTSEKVRTSPRTAGSARNFRNMRQFCIVPTLRSTSASATTYAQEPRSQTQVQSRTQKLRGKEKLPRLQSLNKSRKTSHRKVRLHKASYGLDYEIQNGMSIPSRPTVPVVVHRLNDETYI